MSTFISDIHDLSRTYGSLGTTGMTAKKLASKQRSIDIPKPLQAAKVVAKTTKLADKIASSLSTSTTAELHSTDFLGPAGALAALAVDTMNLAIRSGRVLEFNKELDKLPLDSQLVWKRQVLQAQSRHAQGVAKI